MVLLKCLEVGRGKELSTVLSVNLASAAGSTLRARKVAIMKCLKLFNLSTQCTTVSNILIVIKPFAEVL
jgi:hypothetical protein